MERWVCVRLDKRGLWTADLYDGKILLKNIGGSYPKANQVVIDAKRTWGFDVHVKILPNGVLPTLLEGKFIGDIEI